jgi:hypothetical protein
LKTITIILAASLITGCTQTRVEYIREPVEVKIPVPVDCVDEVDEPPEYATERLVTGVHDVEVVRALLLERNQRAAVEVNLRALLEGCKT